MKDRISELGVARSLWLIIAVGTCVLAGATFNKCLLCGAPPPQQQQQAQAAPPEPAVQGDLINAPAPRSVEPAPAPPEDPPKTEEPEQEEEESPYLGVTFDKLASYVYVYPEMDATKPLQDQIPESIKKLSGRKIALQGFMVPVKLEGEDVVEFLLVRNQFACCFGVMPKMNEWVHVKMAPGKTAGFLMDIPITIFGVLEVGEVIEDGVVMSLYRVECEEVSKPPTFR